MLMCAISSSCSNSAQSAYFRSQSSQTSGDWGKRFLVAPGASKPQKIWVMCAGTREKRCQISFRFARRRREEPESSRMDVQTEGKQRSKAGQHRLPGGRDVKDWVEI